MKRGLRERCLSPQKLQIFREESNSRAGQGLFIHFGRPEGKKEGRFLFLPKRAFKPSKYLNVASSFQSEDLIFPVTGEGGRTDSQQRSH